MSPGILSSIAVLLTTINTYALKGAFLKAHFTHLHYSNVCLSSPTKEDYHV